MNTEEFIAELKSRINPGYAHMLGTESYERRQCVEAIEAQAAEIERLTDDLQIVTDHREQALNNAMVLMKENERQAALLWQCKEILESCAVAFTDDEEIKEALAAIEAYERGEA